MNLLGAQNKLVTGADTGFSEGGGGGDGQRGPRPRGGGVIAPASIEYSAKYYYLNTHNFQLELGGGWSPLPPPDPPLSYTESPF